MWVLMSELQPHFECWENLKVKLTLILLSSPENTWYSFYPQCSSIKNDDLLMILASD